MFSRVCEVSFVCVRCQPWLAGRLRPLSYSNVTIAVSPLRRWRSLLAQHTDHGHNELKPQCDDDEAQREQHLPNAYEDETPSSESQANLPGTFHRHWRPHRAEDLGINVLGKPAEVLILPARTRRQAQLAPERIENEETSGLRESLDSEMKPITMTEVLENIDLFKTDLGKSKQVFSKAEWEEMGSRLSSGFTKAQLQKYLQIALGLGESDSREVSSLANRGKRSIATSIMTGAWKWQCADLGDKPSTSETQKRLPVQSPKLDFIMLHEKQRLRTLSETMDVQIDVFRNKRVIELTGDTSAVSDATAEIHKLVKGLQESTLHIPKELQKHLSNEKKSEPLLAMLMQKHKLFIRKTRDALIIIGATATSGNMVLRDLLLHSSRPSRSADVSFYSDLHEQEAAKVPFCLVDPPQWVQQDSSWYRYATTQSSTETEKKNEVVQKREMKNLAKKILKSENSKQPILSCFLSTPGSRKFEYTVDLGQALFGSKISDDSTSSFEEKSVSAPGFFLQQALLPQVLNGNAFDTVNTSPNKKPAVGETPPQPFLLRIRLRPLVRTTAAPPLEVLLTGQDPSLGFRQQLEIKRVTAIIDQWEHVLLLPHQPLDLLMKRQTTIDLFKITENKSSQAYLAILQQISSYLEEAQIAKRLELPPIWRLDLSSFCKVQTEATLAEYAPEPPEYLDVTSYTSKIVGDRYVDHITCSTDPIDTPQQTQVLQIKDSPLSALLDGGILKKEPSKESALGRQQWFRDSIDAAYNLVTKFREAEESAGNPRPADGVAGPV